MSDPDEVTPYEDEDDLDAMLRAMLSQSCCSPAPERLRYKLVQRFSAHHVHSDNGTYFSISQEQRLDDD